MSLAIHRLREGPDHFLICAWLRRNVLQHLADRSAVDGHAIAVQEVVLKQDLQDLRHAARTVQVDRDEAPGGLEVAEDGHAPSHALEIVDGPFHAGRTRDRQVMQHRVGGAARGHDEGDCVLDRLARDDVARLEIALNRLHQHPRRFGGGIGFLRVRCRHLRGAEQAHAERLERRAHRIGGVHAAAGANARAGVLLDADEILFLHLAGGERADRLEGADDR